MRKVFINERIQDGRDHVALSQFGASRNPSHNDWLQVEFQDGFRDDEPISSPTFTNTVRIGYARTSTRAQDHQMQLDALNAAKCREINLDILTGICAGLHRANGSSIADKMLFMVAAMAAEMERDLIQERTLDGLAAARAHGRTGGRPVALDPDSLAIAVARRAKSESVTEIAGHRGTHPHPRNASQQAKPPNTPGRLRPVAAGLLVACVSNRCLVY